MNGVLNLQLKIQAKCVLKYIEGLPHRFSSRPVDFSEFSTGVVGTSGSSGLLSETLKRVSVPAGTVTTAVVAVLITWTFDIFEIITFASRAFVLYYAIQSAQALRFSIKQRNWAVTALAVVGIVLGLVVLVFATSASV